MKMILLLLSSASALLDDYSSYKNESISFYVPVEGPSRELRRMAVNRRSAPVEHGNDHLVAYVQPLGVELRLDQAHELYSPTYKEFSIGPDGTLAEVRGGPPPCMYVTS